MDTPCKANRGKHGCQEIVTDGGVENSGFCGDCWYPTIETDLNTFHELMAAGYSRSQAGIFSGLVKPDTREVTAEDEDEVDEEAIQDDITSSVIDRMIEDDET
jgi:hypothetical protein